MSAVAGMQTSEARAVWKNARRWSARLVWGNCLAAAPLGLFYFWQLWDRPHYRFFPLYLAALAVLAWQRLSDDLLVNQDQPLPDPAAGDFSPVEPLPATYRGLPPARRAAHMTARLLLWGELATLLLAVVLFSPWMGYVALLLGCGCLAVRLTGSATGGRLGPIWAAAWFLVSPPFDLDVQLIQSLQGGTTLISSRLLDLFGHRHLVEGNVMEFTGRQFFIEEACGGVRSLFSLVAIALLFCVWKGRSWPQTILLVTAAVLWSLAANMLRVTTVGIVYASTRYDLSSGWPHDLLGFVLLGLAVLLLLSTDELIVYVLGEIIVPYGMGRRNPVTRWWNRWVANVAPDSDDNAPGAVDDMPPRTRPIAGPRPLQACAFAVLGLLQLVGLAGAAAAAFAAEQVPLADVVPAESLPENLGAWRRVDSKLEKRTLSSNEGLYSRVWTYNASSQGGAEQVPQFTALVSFDYPFANVHELTRCYKSKGWAIRAREVKSCGWRDGTGEICSVEMLKPSGESAYLLFVEFDRDGRPERLSPRTTAWMDGRLAYNPLTQMIRDGVSRVTLDPGTVYQFQVFVPTVTPLDDEQKQDVRAQFATLRERLLERWAGGRVVTP
ncbi:MAG: exosortase U [Planctomycetia bacterium]|nr:exosortase U [Planctomycetia bacterium]